jgi:hypothetical protein
MVEKAKLSLSEMVFLAFALTLTAVLLVAGVPPALAAVPFILACFSVKEGVWS